ncbi:MAG: TraR/DksA C4-type zinc finger protein [Verrucomicrobiales bacterium]
MHYRRQPAQPGGGQRSQRIWDAPGGRGQRCLRPDFALSLLSKEQDALYEIEEALKRIDKGTYGVCEMSGEKIPHARLEAIPFARFTMECQEQIEKEMEISGYRRVSDMLFGTAEDRAGDEDGDSLDDDN